MDIRTSRRRLQRSFREPRDLEVQVELQAVETAIAADCWEEQPMTSADATKYRAVVARLHCFAIDRPDLQFAVMEASRTMAVPRQWGSGDG